MSLKERNLETFEPKCQMSLMERDRRTPQQNCRRLVVLGSSRVGKSAIMSRFLSDTFDEKYNPTIENFYRKIYKIRGETYRLDILDTSGLHPFPAIRRLSYVTGDMFVLVYDVTNRRSFEEAKEILKQLTEAWSKVASADSVSNLIPPPVILVGNKCDLNKKQEVFSSESWAVLQEGPFTEFAEVSARENKNIQYLFFRLFKLAKLPPEMSPALHRKVTPSYVGSVQRNGILSFVNRKISGACAALHPSVRRPSVNTDLQIAFRRGSLRRCLPSSRKNDLQTSACVIS